MKLAAIRLCLGFAVTVASGAGPLATSADACLFPWMCGSFFGTGGCGSGCCVNRSFYGGGVFNPGCSTFSCYAPSCCAPSFNTSWGSAASWCGTGCGGCGTCGTSPCSLSGGCCDNGWSGTCGSIGCASGNCSTGDCLTDSGSSVVPYSGDPVPDTARPSTPSNPVMPDGSAQPPNRTYKEQPTGDGFQPPRQEPGSGSGGANPFGGSGTGSNPGLITPPTDDPATSQPNPGINFERDGEQGLFKIPAKDHVEPQPADTDADESQIVKPLEIQTRVAFRAESSLSRARYRAVFHAPSVNRTDVPATGGWEPISETRLAASR